MSIERNVLETLIENLEDIFADADTEAREALHSDENTSRQYWQGQKDGIRKAIVLLATVIDDEKLRRHWKTYQESSLGLRLSKLEKVTLLCNDAVYYIGEVLWALSGGNIHPLTVTNMKQWFWRYRQLAKAGIVPEANDTCYSEEE